MLAICSKNEPVVFKAPKPSSNVERVPQGLKPVAKPRHKKHSTSSKQPSVSSKEATKVGPLKHPLVPKLAILRKEKNTEMHKEDQQATGGLTSLRVISEARANPQLSSGKGANSVARQVKEEEASSTIKLEDLAKTVLDVQPNFKDLDSPEDAPVIIVDDSDADEEDEVHATTSAETKDTLAPKTLCLRSSQIQELTNQVLILQS
ncbi:hypothetical protein Tco_0133543 [Tanacetum coccineum]